MRTKFLLIILLFVVFTKKNNAQSGLIACYPLDNNANDFSGNSYNGTAYNVTPTTSHLGVANGAYHFSGSGSYIDLPYSNFLLNQFTYSVWCRLTGLPSSGNYYSVVAVGGTTADQSILIGNDGNHGNVGFGSSSWNSNPQGIACYQGFVPTPNQWYHVVMTRDDSTINLYINDTLICSTSSGAANAGYLGSSLDATIGSRLSSTAQNFLGDIDDLKIFNRVLSLSEIQNMTDSCVSTPVSCLTACYPLNNSANDFSGNAYNGTAYNVTPTTGHSGGINTAYYFSGSSSYIDLPYSNFLFNQFTYSAWCRLTGLPSSGNYYSVVAVGGTTSDQAILIGNDGNHGNVGFGSSSWNSNPQGIACYQGFLPTPNQWYHVVMTRDNSTINLYINDTLICSTSSGGANAGYLGSSLDATIGSRLSSTAQNFLGDIDDVRIFDCVLSPTEIQNMSATCITTGIDEFSKNENSLIIYPNPVTSSFILKLATQLSDAELVIYDVLGKELLRKKLSGDKMEIERGGLESGVYFVTVRSSDWQRVEKMVVE